MAVLPEFTFSSRRSPVYASKGMAAASQPAAVEAGLTMLRRGGSAVDAALAMAAALAVIEPCSTGLGGDGFALLYDGKTHAVSAVNGSGRSGRKHTLEQVHDFLGDEAESIPSHHGLAVTVPGVCAMWCDMHARMGTLPLKEILAPAIRLAREGHIVGPVTSELWVEGTDLLRTSPNGRLLLQGSKPPFAGTVMKNPVLAKVLESIAVQGAKALYEGALTAHMVAAVTAAGGVLTEEDFSVGMGATTWSAPLSLEYGGVTVHECPPNGQGIVALQALGILKHAPVQTHAPASAERLHWQIEALRLAFADARRFVCEPRQAEFEWSQLLKQPYLAGRAARITPDKRMTAVLHGTPHDDCDTVQFCVIDKDGNAVSMVTSIYGTFGSGIIPDNCGFAMQSRGSNFSLVPAHPNCIGPVKRPYHTIIPCLTTRSDGSLHGVMGVMGGFMQPQGHVQILSALLDDGCTAQEALDRLRFCIEPDGTVAIEAGFADSVLEELAAKHHQLMPVTGYERKLFGRGQIILRTTDGVLSAGSDPRADGCAFGIW